MIRSRTAKRQSLRHELWAVMNGGRDRAGHAFQFGLLILIILSVAILPLELFPGTENVSDTLFLLDAVFVGLFAMEYALRLYAAPNRLRYAVSATGIVDLLCAIPFYGGVYWGEYLRLVRLVRLLKVLSIRKRTLAGDSGLHLKNIALLEGEKVEYVIRRHPFYLLFSTVPPLVALSFGIGVLIVADVNPISLSISVALILFSFVFLWNGWRDFAYDVIYLTNLRLIFQNQHLLGRSINHVDYRQITNVKPYYPHALAFILRFGSISIDTAAETTGKIDLDTVRKHEKAAHLIMQKTLR